MIERGSRCGRCIVDAPCEVQVPLDVEANNLEIVRIGEELDGDPPLMAHWGSN